MRNRNGSCYPHTGSQHRFPALRFRFLPCGEVQHPLDTDDGFFRRFAIDEDFVFFRFEHVCQIFQRIHRHPGALRAALAGRAMSGRRCLDKGFSGNLLLHLVENPLVSSHNESCGIHGFRRIQNLGCRAHHIGLCHHRSGRFGMNQYFRTRMLLFQQIQFGCLEFVMDKTGPLP